MALLRSRNRWALGLLLAVCACTTKDAPPSQHDVTPDTVPGVDADTAPSVDAVDSLAEQDTTGAYEATAADTAAPAGRRAASTRAGLAIGPSAYEADQWCRGTATGTYFAAPPEYVLPMLRKAALCNMAVLLVVPRRLQTANADGNGLYSVSRVHGAIDAYARISGDSLRRYLERGTLRGFVLLDDMACARCWGGRVVSQAQAEEAYSYAQGKPSLTATPWGIRGTAAWIKVRPSLAASVDFVMAQYVMTRGDPAAYFVGAVRDAKALNPPVRIGLGANIYHFSKPNDGRPATAAELDKVLKLAVEHPDNCFSMSWKWWPGWRDAGRGAVWDRWTAAAGQRGTVPSCGR